VILKRFMVAAALATLGLTLWPASVEAQRRGVVRVQRAPVVRVQRAPRVVVRGSAYWGYPYYSYAFGPWMYPYEWYGSYSYGQRSPYGRYYDGAALRLQVTPKTAEVFVDGYFAGHVDEFDGTFQRLRLEPGEHEIAVYADGFRTLTQRLYLQPLGSVNIRESLQPLQPGDVQEPRPTPPPGSATTERRTPARPRTAQEPPDDAARQSPPPAPSDVTFGTLSILVQPGGSEVLLDGERWEGPGGNERLLVQLAPGTHLIEVRRPGYQTFSRTIEVRAGQTEAINVSLTRQ
jgi:hypothetical protein